MNNIPFDEGKYLKNLNAAITLGTPYMAVVPDIMCGGTESLEYSLKWLKRLPIHFPWYLAVQDGMTIKDIEPVINEFAGIFLGGSNKFKATAFHWCKLAHKHGKKFHYGRAGTIKKVQHAKAVGSDSCDSAFPLWNIERLDCFISVWQHGTAQMKMDIDEEQFALMP